MEISQVKSSEEEDEGRKTRDSKRLSHVHDERMIDAEQDVLLVLHVLDLFESDHVGNGQDFQRPVLARALLPAQHYPSERSSSCERERK